MKRALVIFRKELRDTIRDRRTLVAMVVVPVLLMPLIVVGSVKLQEWSTRSRTQDIVQLRVTGAEYSAGLMAQLASDAKIELVQTEGDPVTLLKDGKIDAHLIIDQDFDRMAAAGNPGRVTIQNNSTKNNSVAAVDKVNLSINVYSEAQVAETLKNAGLSSDILNLVVLEVQDTSTQKERGGSVLGLILPMFLVTAALVGGMYTAMDISAGEKERKTLEALLMTPASREEIVAGKFLAVATVAVVTIILSVSAIFITAPLVSNSLGAVDISLDVPTALVMLPIAVLLAAMFAALLLAISIFARSYKEAQNYVTPLYLLAVLPAVVVAVPSGHNAIQFVIPGFNAVILFRELLLGEFLAVDILLTAFTLVIYTFASLRWASRVYSREDVLVDEGGGRRKRRALRVSSNLKAPQSGI